MVTSRAVYSLRCSFLEKNFWSWSADHCGNLSESCLILLWKSSDTRKSKGGQKGCEKKDDGALLVRAFPPLSHVYLARYSSKRPEMQARHRLRGREGWGSTLLYMLSLLTVCGISGASFWAYVVLGCSFNLLMVFWSRSINDLVWSWVGILENCPFTFYLFFWEIRII